MGQLIQELKRRNVIRVAVAYAVSAWLLIQVAETIFPLYGFDEGPARIIVTVLAICFPLTLVLSWIYELTPEGLKLDRDVDRSHSIAHHTGKKLDRAIIVILTLALGYFAVDKFVLDPVRDTEREKAIANQVRSDALVQSFGDKSIAVLPFVDMSPLGDQEYFSDGIAEELLNVLAKIHDLRVISRSSAFSFKGKDIDVPQIAEQLNVAHMLAGSVRKDGDDIRITVQLIDARSDTHLWSATYDRKLENIFAIQDDIATAVVDELKITLLGEAPKAAETSPEAYTLYLQGRHFFNQFTEEGHERAETLLKQALENDPDFAPAWTNLAFIYFWREGEDGEGAELARDAIQRALDTDPEYGPAYALLARIELESDWDISAANQHRQQALALDPGNAEVLRWAGWMELTLGRFDNAIDLTQRSIAVDPAGFAGHFNLGYILYCAHRLEEAADTLRLAASLNPDFGLSQFVLGLVLLAQDETSRALTTMSQLTREELRLAGTAIVQYELNDVGASDAALELLIERNGRGFWVAQIYAFRTEIDHAFYWLEQSYDGHDESLVNLLRDPLFANLHDDPRWRILLGKMGIPH